MSWENSKWQQGLDLAKQLGFLKRYNVFEDAGTEGGNHITIGRKTSTKTILTIMQKMV